MNSEFKLAVQLTMVDMLSGVAQNARRNILSMGDAGKQVAKDFDLMTTHITRGLKGIARANYAVAKIKPGVGAAADLQESMIDVRMNMMRSGQDAKVLGKELAEVRRTAIELQKITPFSAVDVVKVQNELISSGVEFKDVVGNGATRAAMMLATITKAAPESTAGIMLGVGVPYGLKGKEYGEVGDVIQKHVMSGRMKMPHLEAALPYAAPYAKAYGVPWHDLLTGLAVLGEQGQLGSHAGTGLKDFYERLTGTSRISRRVMGAMNRDLVGKGKAPLEFWDKKGELLPTHDIIKNMRASFGSYNRHQRMFILQKYFGEQGGLAALNLMSTGTGSWEFIKQKVSEVTGAEEKMNERLKGFSANVTALGGTTKTTLATLFDPMLGPLTRGTKLINEMVDGVGKLAEKHPTMNAVGNGVLGVVAGAAAGYGIWNLVKGAGYGKKVLSQIGLKGLFGTGVGVAEGKALQAAAGITPVFVVNMPAGGLGPTNIPTEVPVAARALPWAAMAGGAGLTAVAAGIPVSMAISNAMRENGWGSQTHDRGSKEYEVMGIGGRKRDINLSIQIDGNGRVVSSSDDMTSRITTIKRGSFFDTMMTSH
ncbi:MAG: phage tail tape measure protein [Geobacteraceae bacterium]|nr:phage tail tape measure protein [Geobacteraceae bacterium]